MDLLAYLERYGVVACNTNAYLPALEDVGCTWLDAVALIDRQQAFLCKAFRKRTVYLSREAYYLLKCCRARPPLPDGASRLYALLSGSSPMDTRMLKSASALPEKDYARAFSFLLENLYVTALHNGKPLNPNWSTLLYGTAEAWEEMAPDVCSPADARAELTRLLSQSLSEGELRRFLC